MMHRFPNVANEKVRGLRVGELPTDTVKLTSRMSDRSRRRGPLRFCRRFEI
jgi:hypothetical protein